MSYTSYHNTTSPQAHVWEAGDVVRINGESPFMDAVVLGFNDKGYAKLARPYVYASSVGTTGPTALAGVEYIEMVDLTRANWTKVASSRFKA